MTNFIDPRQWERERALFRYALALDRGDAATITAILEQAEEDAILEQMILDWHVAIAEDDDALIFAHDAELVQRLAEEHLVSGEEGEAVEPTPLTIKDVIARLHDDPQIRSHLTVELEQLAALLVNNQTPLPDDLSLGALQQLLASQGIPLFSRPFLKVFRDTAIYLAMGHEQAVNLAAARRQQSRKPQSKERKEPQS
jgi:hypothetical protein